MFKRRILIGVSLGVAMALVPSLPHSTAHADSLACTGWSGSFGGDEDQEAAVMVSIAGAPAGQKFFLNVRILNNGKIIGKVTAVTDSTGSWSGSIPTKYDPAKQQQGVIETTEQGCNSPVIVAVKIDT